jgi:LPXTG-motif cell wall-anchored protein
VCEEQQADWTQTFPQVGGTPPPGESIIDQCPGGLTGYEFTAASGQTFTSDDFGNFKSAPVALVSHGCAASGLDVTVKNTGNLSGTFEIDGVSQVLAPGASFTVNVAVAEGSSVDVSVLLDGLAVAGSPFTFLRDCEQGGAAAVDNCSLRGADLALTNSGVSPTTLTVFKNGVVIDVVVLAGGSAVFKTYPLAEDEIAVFRVTAPGFDSGDLVINHNCVGVSSVPVITTYVPPSPQLASTGSPDTAPLALTGGLFMGTGLLALVVSRRRRNTRLA